VAEDNDVRFSPEVVNTDGNNPWIVPYSGARVVIRHDTIVNSQLEIYRVRPGALGCQSSEIYGNTFSAEGLKMGRPQGFIFIAGGAALVFNNTVVGTTYNTRTIQVSHERSFGAFGEFGICDGTNPMDGNQIPVGRKGAGYPAFAQPGRATDANGDGVFEPAPCYAWNNTLNGAKLNMALRPGPITNTRRNRQSTSRKDGISSTRSPVPSITGRTFILIRCKRAGARQERAPLPRPGRTQEVR
jgi:hypothetical protein